MHTLQAVNPCCSISALDRICIWVLDIYFSLFTWNRVFITTNAEEKLHPVDVKNAYLRHTDGDWGDLCPEAVEENRRAFKEGGQLLSVYHDRRQTKFYILTNADRSKTTIFMDEEC